MRADPPGSRSALSPVELNQQGGPTVLRIVLGTQLRRWREASGITREAAGAAIRASHAKITAPFGAPHVMRAQLEHLLEMSGLPNVLTPTESPIDA